MKIGDVIRVTIDTVAFGGDGVGRVNNMVVFVPFTVDGDVVDVRITEVKKKYLCGEIDRIALPSPTRVIPKCVYFGRCGGCQYQHIAYEHQCAMKEQQVIDSFERIAKIASPPVTPIIPSPKIYNYRGKAEYHLNSGEDGTPQVGFMDVSGGALVNIDHCDIVDETINQSYCSFRESLVSGEVEYEDGRYTFWSGTDFGGTTEGKFRFVERVAKDMVFRVPYEGFFQTNEHLVDAMGDYVLKKGAFRQSDVVVDLYCGTGLFLLSVAPLVHNVNGIEVDGEAVRCARYNIQKHGCENAKVIKGRAETILKKRTLAEKNIAAVILDPPRVGCAKEVLAGIIAIRPETIVYISCNPATQARDVRYLTERGFSLVNVQPVDMFPQTQHIEVMALLKRTGN